MGSGLPRDLRAVLIAAGTRYNLKLSKSRGARPLGDEQPLGNSAALQRVHFAGTTGAVEVSTPYGVKSERAIGKPIALPLLVLRPKLIEDKSGLGVRDGHVDDAAVLGLGLFDL